MFGRCLELHRAGLIVSVPIPFLLCNMEMTHPGLTLDPIVVVLFLAYDTLLCFLLGGVLCSFLQEVP